jgi:general secretion pathway protein D
MFYTSRSLSDKERVELQDTDDGSRILIRSSLKNYEVVKKLVEQLDTPDADQRETRTYTIKHLQASDLATQLETLYSETSSRNPWDYYSRGRGSSDTAPKFVSISRTNQLLAMAKNKDFTFIEKMIGELDLPVDPETIEPRIYQVRNTDANELVKVLQELFQQNNRNQNFFGFRQTADAGSIASIFGDIRFVVDNVTNRLVVLTSHAENYAVIERMIERFDQFDPETSQVLTIELKYADPIDVAERINNLLSEGAVQQQRDQQQGGGNNNNNNNNNNNREASSEFTNDLTAQVVRSIIFPWQSGGQQQRTGLTEERPVNTMIGNVRIVPDARSNRIMVAAPPIYFEALQNLIMQLDQPEPQVNIETRILEMTRNNERRIGIRWTPDPNTIEPGELENAFVGLGQLGFLNASGDEDSGPFGADFGGLQNIKGPSGMGNTVLGADLNLALLIQLLVKNSETKIVSEPSITVYNNEVGRIFVGSEFPFRSGSTNFDTGNTNTQIDYRNVGIDMNIRPQINTIGEVVLGVNLLNSKVRDERVNGDLVVDKTTVETKLTLETGQTMVMGGIVVEDDFEVRRGLPILSKIPFIGSWLFGKKDNLKAVRELLVFITPEVLNSREADDILLERSRARIGEQEPLPGAAEAPGADASPM